MTVLGSCSAQTEDLDGILAPALARPIEHLFVNPLVCLKLNLVVCFSVSLGITLVCFVAIYCRLQMLAAEVDAIIHSGASVNLLRSYESLKPVNVLGTQV